MGKESWERQRLKDLYSQLSDGVLEEIALDWADLTVLARNEIKDEAARRGLILDTEETPPVSDPLDNSDTLSDFLSGLVTLDVFGSLEEAVVVKGLLESAGIESFLSDGFNSMPTDQTISPVGLFAIGGIQLRVKAEDVEAAKECLAQPLPEDPGNTED
jgi:hypothetical protein